LWDPFFFPLDSSCRFNKPWHVNTKICPQLVLRVFAPRIFGLLWHGTLINLYQNWIANLWFYRQIEFSYKLMPIIDVLLTRHNMGSNFIEICLCEHLIVQLELLNMRLCSNKEKGFCIHLVQATFLFFLHDLHSLEVDNPFLIYITKEYTWFHQILRDCGRGYSCCLKCFFCLEIH
jgi:hypothetical protein